MASNGRRVVVGIVGAGFAAEFHAESYKKVHGVDLVLKGVASQRVERARDFQWRHSIRRAYDSIEAMLEDPEINLIDLSVPNHLHEPFCVMAAEAGKHVVCEKPLTGYYGEKDQEDVGKTVPRSVMLEGAIRSADAIISAFRKSGVKLMYAENWVYAPAIQKADRLLSRSDNTIFRIVGEESHSGSHSEAAKRWRTAGGGSLVHKGCHPLGAAIYLKYQEGLRKDGRPIRVKSVVAEMGNLTHIPSFVQEGEKWVKTGWVDVEDWGCMLLRFDDGSAAQISAADTVLGGINNRLTVFSSGARINCNINSNDCLEAYAPDPCIFGDEYIVEKIETKAGWSYPSPDEDWMNGFYQEIQDFAEAAAFDREPKSGAMLARDVVVAVYGAYLSAHEGRRVELSSYLESVEQLPLGISGLGRREE